MSRTIELAYGREPLVITVGHRACVVDLPDPGPPGPLAPMLAEALARPVEAERLRHRVRAGDRVLVIVSDGSRDEPRDAMVRAVLDEIGVDVRLTIAVANGTHAPGDLGVLGLGDDLLARAERVVNHDAHAGNDFVVVGTTRRGTPLRVNRCLVETDHVIATGRIKPHYFAGFGAGAKALFPGLGANDEIRRNHLLKSDPESRAGVVDDNPCRNDIEEIGDFLRPPPSLLNVVTDARGRVQRAVAGDLRTAFREGARHCDPLFRVRAPMADVVIVTDKLPLTASLYQASKLAAAGAPLVRPGGSLVVVAECPDGTGPVDTVNRGIYEIGIKPRLPADCSIYLVSALDEATVAPTYCRWARSVEACVGPAPDAVVLRGAGVMIVEVA